MNTIDHANTSANKKAATGRTTIIPAHAIVVGLDHSPQSTAALEWAAAEAICREVPLHLMHAVQPPLWLGPDGVEDFDPEPAACIADARRALADTYAGLDVTWSQPYGSALPALTWASRFATLVVVGTRGHGPIRRVVTGSTAVELIADAHCPVVVSPTSLLPMHETGPVVVGLEGRESDGDALHAAFREAAGRQRTLVVVHATDYGLLERIRIQNLVAAERREYPRLNVKVRVEQGDPADLLMEHSAEASLLVLGSRGRHEAAGVVLGSVSQAILRRAACPVLIAREGTLRPYEISSTKDDADDN